MNPVNQSDSWAYNRGVVQQGSTTAICFSRRIREPRTTAVQLDQSLAITGGLVDMNWAMSPFDILVKHTDKGSGIVDLTYSPPPNGELGGYYLTCSHRQRACISPSAVVAAMLSGVRPSVCGYAWLGVFAVSNPLLREHGCMPRGVRKTGYRKQSRGVPYADVHGHVSPWPHAAPPVVPGPEVAPPPPAGVPSYGPPSYGPYYGPPRPHYGYYAPPPSYGADSSQTEAGEGGPVRRARRRLW